MRWWRYKTIISSDLLLFHTNCNVVYVLLQIVNRYDLLLIQEIREASESAIYELLALCNAANSDPFNIVISERLGRSSYKEQYAFFFR